MKGGGATAAVTDRADVFKAWLAHHQLVGVSTLKELIATPFTSVMTWLMIGIALGLPAIFYVVLQNVDNVSEDWGGKPTISVYLVDELEIAAGRSTATDIETLDGVESTRFISSDQALEDFQTRSGFGDVLDTLDDNPLPHLVEVIPAEADPLAVSSLVQLLEEKEAVARVSVDLQWLERLRAILEFAERLVAALGAVLGVGVVLVMGNTIRLAIENRRQEIEVIKLVGGTDSFVRRPFLYLGFWYGFGGAVVAYLLLQISLVVLAGPVEAIAQSYRDAFALTGPGFGGLLLLLLVGSVLGVAGSVIAVAKHLSDIEPG